ncbi:MAG: tetratricopeptide repeat protein, partial [Candidatus Celaenobacter polaris]|nr:tetratricopeptide repeat protein [Candidatus Celaenobacter polaris]
RSKINKQLRNEILTREDLKNKNFTFDFIINKDNSLLAFVERGRNNILRALQEINPLISKKRLFYSYIEPAEISLMNIVRDNYNFSDEDYVLIIYISIDTKFGIVMRGNDFVRSFPIIVPETDIGHMRQVIYSKIILEQDTSNVNITSNIILAGEMAKDDDVKYFRSRINSGANISRITLDKLHIPQAKEQDFAPERIADYCIPIALAWKSLEGRNKNFYSCNLLPSKIIENQKSFKISWHGFIIMAVIFYVAFSATSKNLNVSKEIIRLNRENGQVMIELTKNRPIVAKLKQVKAEIAALQSNLKKIDNLVEDKNQWYYILNVISNSFKEHKISWLTSLNSQEETFKVSGFTTRKRNVIPFSNLFPNGNIVKVTENTIQNVSIWQYDIIFGYPDPLEVAKQKKEGEPGIEFIKDKEQLRSPQVQIEKIKPAEEKQEKPVTKTQTASNNDKIRYHQITDLYFSGYYQQAYDEYSEFLTDFPDSKYTHNASYLMGECLYQMDDINQAILIFKKLIEQKGLKTPDALMMLGNAYAKNQNISQAKIYWNRVIAEYPNDRLAPIAKNKIEYNTQITPQPQQVEEIQTQENKTEMLYELQLYADSNYDNVLNEQNKLNVLGYNTKIIPVSTSNGIIYRLRIDDKLSRDDALALGEKISAQQNAYHDFWITEAMRAQEPVDKTVEIQSINNKEKIQKEYSAILNKYFSNDLQGAYDGFYSFMTKYPDSELAANSRYFMGEAQYQMDNIPEAISIFEVVVKQNSIKTPDALMMLGNAHAQLKANDKALYYWNELISRYPKHRLSDVAQLKAIEIKD